jgi:hypothetical protein
MRASVTHRMRNAAAGDGDSGNGGGVSVVAPERESRTDA